MRLEALNSVLDLLSDDERMVAGLGANRRRARLAIQFAMMALDDHLRAGEFEAIDDWLATFPIERWDIAVVLTALTSTLMVKDRFPSRPALFERTEVMLRRTRPNDCDSLLAGLR